MSPETGRSSLELWRRYGAYVLMAFPAVDNVIDRAEGSFLIDVEGNRLLDLASGQLCATVGMRHPVLSERVARQAQRVCHTGTQFFTEAVFEAAEKFASVAPGGLRRSVFLSTGSEANECAFRMAKLATGRTGIVGLSRGYYGMTLATRSVTSIFAENGRTDSSPVVPESGVLLAPHCARCPLGLTFPGCNIRCLDASIEMLGRRRTNVAAFVVEPLMSAGGMIVPPPGYLARLQAAARRNGSLLIADEAQTAFGRTGRWFGVEHQEIVPDILVVSKSAGGGVPASGVIVSADLADVLERRGFVHLASHQWDPLPAAAISAVIDIVRDEGLVGRAEMNGRHLFDRLRALQRRWPVIREVRGLGLMVGLELEGALGKVPEGLVGLAMVEACRRRGVHLTTTYFEPTLRIMPPLVITPQEIDFAVSVLDDALEELSASAAFRVESLLPRNPESRRFAERMLGRRDWREVMSKLWTTSPRDLLGKATRAWRG